MAAQLVLLGLTTGTVVLLLALSNRRVRLARGAVALAAGALAGYSPALFGWWVLGQRPESGAGPSCPTELGDRLGLVARVLLPTLAGDSAATETVSLRRPEALVALAGAALVMLAFAWHWRHTLLSLATLEDDRRTDPVVRAFVVLLLLNVGVAVASGSTLDAAGVRHLFPAWQGYTVVAGVGFASLWRSARPLFGAAVVLLLAAAVPNVTRALNTQTSGPWSPPAVQALERHLVERGVSTGFADYWTAYVIDFLSEERLRLTTLRGPNRYHGYDAEQASSPLAAYVFEPGELPPGADVFDATDDRLRGVIRPDLREWMASQVVVEQARVDRWEVVVGSEGGRVNLRFLAAVARPISRSFGGILTLEGYTIDTDETRHELIARLFWRAEAKAEHEYQAFVYVLDEEGLILGQHDHSLGEAAGNPPHRWSVGDIVADTHRVMLPPNGRAQYRLEVALYDLTTGYPLWVRRADATEGTAVILDATVPTRPAERDETPS